MRSLDRGIERREVQPLDDRPDHASRVLVGQLCVEVDASPGHLRAVGLPEARAALRIVWDRLRGGCDGVGQGE